MPSKKSKRSRPAEACPSTADSEPGKASTAECNGCCATPDLEPSTAAPEPYPVPADETVAPPTSLVEATAPPEAVSPPSAEAESADRAEALENETEIMVAEKPATKKPRKSPKQKDRGEAKSSRAPNAYMLFYQDELKKDAYAGISLPERAKMIGALWRQMDDNARSPFQERVARAKEALAPINESESS